MVKRKPKRKRGVNLGGHPSHVPTEQNRTLIQYMLINERPQTAIAEALGITVPTLYKFYRGTLRTGKDRIDAMMTQSIISMGIGLMKGAKEPDPAKAVPSMAKFYAEAKMNWMVKPHQVQVSGAVGTVDLTNATDEELDRMLPVVLRLESPEAAAARRSAQEEAAFVERDPDGEGKARG